MRKYAWFALSALVLVRLSFGLAGCANIIPPTGGPKDTLPPVLVKALPDNLTRNFSGRKIVLNFDEYVELKDTRKNLIVSPMPKRDPLIESKLRTVTITLYDTLKPNTTYSLNFGRAIQDVNEGNVLKNFTYIFSTGPYIDSMTYSGHVLMAATGRPDSTITVMLHDQLDDSAVYKSKPRYIARVDSGGNFRFHHLQPGKYALYALKDEGAQYKYTTHSMIFAFADSPVAIGQTHGEAMLYAYEDTTGQKPVKKPSAAKNTAPPKKAGEKERPHLALSASLSGGMLDLLTPFQLMTQLPMKYFDSGKVQLVTDSFKTVGPFHFEMDSTRKKLVLTTPRLKPDTKYKLILQKDFAQDTLGNQLLKIDTLSFATKKESDYGSVRLRFRGVDGTRSPVLQFVQSDKVVLSWPFGNARVYQNKLFVPGEYELRILYDRNGNGHWDPGDFFGVHRQPEIVQPIKRKLTVRANWDNQLDISL